MPIIGYHKATSFRLRLKKILDFYNGGNEKEVMRFILLAQ